MWEWFITRKAPERLTRKLARRLHDLGELPCVAGDAPNFCPDADIPFRLLVRDGQIIGENAKEAILKEWAKRGRLLIDIQVGHPLETLINFLNYTEIVLWCLRPQDAERATHILRQISQSARWVREKVHIVWLLDAATEVAPDVPQLIELSRRDFKLSFEAPQPTRGQLTANGFERIVHFLRGVQIGLRRAAARCAAWRTSACLRHLRSKESTSIKSPALVPAL